MKKVPVLPVPTLWRVSLLTNNSIVTINSNMSSLKELAVLITTLKNPLRLEAFLRELLTPAEIQEITKRLAIFKMLLEGIPQREIASKLHTSLCAVTRGSKELQKEKSIFKEILGK